jgi:hypothetical protein
MTPQKKSILTYLEPKASQLVSTNSNESSICLTDGMLGSVPGGVDTTSALSIATGTIYPATSSLSGSLYTANSISLILLGRLLALGFVDIVVLQILLCISQIWIASIHIV